MVSRKSKKSTLQYTARASLADYLRSLGEAPVAANARADAMHERAREHWNTRRLGGQQTSCASHKASHVLRFSASTVTNRLLRTNLHNKNLSQHVTVGRSPDQSRDPGSLSGLHKQSPDQSHARSHAQSHVKSLAPLSVSGPLTSAWNGSRRGTSPLSIVDRMRGTPLARSARIIPTHRPINSHDRGKTSHG
jgi:hypothetical protein